MELFEQKKVVIYILNLNREELLAVRDGLRLLLDQGYDVPSSLEEFVDKPVYLDE